MREITREVRELAHSLKPSALDDLGLLEALVNYFESFKSRTDLNIKFEHAGLEHRLPEESETVIFRIIQEALTNFSRYAKVNEVEVSLRVKNGLIYLEINDRGIGFDPSAILSNSLGIRWMQERAELLGGTLVVETSPGSGTCIRVEIPLIQ